MSTASDVLSQLATTFANESFNSLASKLTTSIVSAGVGPMRKVYETITANFRPHLQATYLKCTKVKTILHREAPVDLLSIYVGPTFKSADKQFDDFSAIERIREGKRVVVSGTGGTGKTIFMKYLWITLFENPQGKIPVFVELRKLNGLNEDLSHYIYRTIINTNSKVTPDAFSEALKAGAFVFLLDGFDELVGQDRDRYAREILELSGNNPSSVIVVSSRPDQIFDSWQAFSTFNVQPLSMEQVVELINKISFDPVTKEKFVERIKSDLYEKHTTFLSSPLLATLMLITFNEFADIPAKLYLFYDLAFETLFYKHDTTKELFQRKMHAGLSGDLFRRLFSLFCLFSYYEEKFEFTESEARLYIERGVKFENLDVDPALFLRDLVESVCIMQWEGATLVFSHRSFQEYFAAWCVDRVVRARADKLLPIFALRVTDTVISMLFDMDQELVEDRFVSPLLAEICGLLKDWGNEQLLEHYLQFAEFNAHFVFEGKGHRQSSQGFSNEKAQLIDAAAQLYPDMFRSILDVHSKLDAEEVPFGPFSEGGNAGSFTIGVVGKGQGKLALGITATQGEVPDINDLTWTYTLALVQIVKEMIPLLPKLQAEIEKKRARKNKTLDEVLGS